MIRPTIDLRDKPTIIGHSAAQFPQVPQQLQIVLQGLPEPEARIDRDAIGRDARGPADFNALEQKRLDLVHDVVIVGSQLHGAGVALHVHHAQGAAARGCSLQRARLGECPDIVEEAGSGRGRGAHDLRLAGVDGDNSVGLSAQALDDRDNAPDFFFCGDRIGARDGWTRRRHR